MKLVEFMRDVKALDVGATLDAAAAAVGGIRALSRELEWDPGSIIKARSTQKLSPYRTAQLSRFTGQNHLAAVIESLADGAKSEAEVQYWQQYLPALAEEVAELSQAVLAALQEDWVKYPSPPSEKLQRTEFSAALRQALTKRWSGGLNSAADSLPKAARR
jgi:vancomycin resistance protein YoaR